MVKSLCLLLKSPFPSLTQTIHTKHATDDDPSNWVSWPWPILTHPDPSYHRQVTAWLAVSDFPRHGPILAKPHPPEAVPWMTQEPWARGAVEICTSQGCLSKHTKAYIETPWWWMVMAHSNVSAHLMCFRDLANKVHVGVVIYLANGQNGNDERWKCIKRWYKNDQKWQLFTPLKSDIVVFWQYENIWKPSLDLHLGYRCWLMTLIDDPGWWPW